MADKQVLVSVGLLRKMADYVGQTQPELEKASKLQTALSTAAPETVDVLAKQGLISPHLKEAKARAYQDNALEIINDLRTTAGFVKTESMGGPSGEGDHSGPEEENSGDVFARMIMGEGQA